ncbi:hypothetical protein REPUB_Repub16aG0097500 [Reevesia pubescens]
MKESLGADLAALEAKEIEREMLKREKNQMLAVKEANEKLVADCLEAGDKKNFDAQKDMLGAIEAAMNPGPGGNGNMLGVIEAAMNSGNMLAAIEAAMIPGAGGDGNMVGAIEAAMNPGADGDGNNAQGFGGDYGGKTNTQNLDEEAVNVMATIEGTNGGGE